jgi:hypothetical protein
VRHALGARFGRAARRRPRSWRWAQSRRRGCAAPRHRAHTRLGPELEQLAALQAAHDPDALLSALERAVRFGRWKAAGVRSILDAGTGVPTPTEPGQALVLELPATKQGPLSDYRLDDLTGGGS